MNVESGSREPDNSQVFLVRLWPGEVAGSGEAAAAAEAEGASMESDGMGIRGKVTHLLSGKASSFSDGDTLVSLLVDMLPKGHDADNLEVEKGATP
ncbi:MAG: hypothetical protein M3437_01800 [Chloroflexota bacterium]|nr:hypothetical protein [Chloroflexota bacterium]MDQ5865178.1 hypothetical protein [Chloroflexota bacterium]